MFINYCEMSVFLSLKVWQTGGLFAVNICLSAIKLLFLNWCFRSSFTVNCSYLTVNSNKLIKFFLSLQTFLKLCYFTLSVINVVTYFETTQLRSNNCSGLCLDCSERSAESMTWRLQWWTSLCASAVDQNSKRSPH